MNTYTIMSLFATAALGGIASIGSARDDHDSDHAPATAKHQTVEVVQDAKSAETVASEKSAKSARSSNSKVAPVKETGIFALPDEFLPAGVQVVNSR